MVNLHYNYIQQLMAKAKVEIECLHHKDAMKHIVTAFSHIDVMVNSQKIRGDVPLDSIEDRRIELIELVNQIPPTLHY